MEKLKLEHLVPYLPYKLKILVDGVICEVEGIDLHNKDTLIAERVNYKFKDIKLLLHPLSDLTKEIEYNGEKFIPLIKLTGFNTEKRYDRIIYEIKNNFSVYHRMQKLIEWNFDVYGLIEKGLAIDINTLNR